MKTWIYYKNGGSHSYECIEAPKIWREDESFLRIVHCRNATSKEGEATKYSLESLDRIASISVDPFL